MSINASVVALAERQTNGAYAPSRTVTRLATSLPATKLMLDVDVSASHGSTVKKPAALGRVAVTFNVAAVGWWNPLGRYGVRSSTTRCSGWTGTDTRVSSARVGTIRDEPRAQCRR